MEDHTSVITHILRQFVDKRASHMPENTAHEMDRSLYSHFIPD